MAEQQSDDFNIYGLLPDHAARGTIKVEDLRLLVLNYLSVILISYNMLSS